MTEFSALKAGILSLSMKAGAAGILLIPETVYKPVALRETQLPVLLIAKQRRRQSVLNSKSDP